VAADEWAEVIHWSLPLAGVLPEVVELVSKGPAGQAGRDTILFYQLSESQEVMQHPAALADLLAYLLAPEVHLFHDCEYVAEIVRKLLDAGASRAALRALAELGCDNAQELSQQIEDAAEP
jgi:hypothetical protein